MTTFLNRLRILTRRTLWSIIVAYMLGIHNFYKGEDKAPDDIVVIVEVNDVKGDGIPK